MMIEPIVTYEIQNPRRPDIDFVSPDGVKYTTLGWDNHAQPTGRWKIVLKENTPCLYLEMVIRVERSKRKKVGKKKVKKRVWWVLWLAKVYVDQPVYEWITDIEEIKSFYSEDEINTVIEYPIQECSDAKEDN